MNVHARLAATGLVLTLLGAACSPEADRKAEPAAAPAVAASPDVHSFRIGTMEAFALKDGAIPLPNAAGQSPWSDTEAAAAVLTAAGQPTGVIPLSIQPLLIRAGDRVVLIDTGARGQMGTENRLMASLRAAGVEPGQVTDILISHTHDDHVGGLVDANGALAFPNAAIRMSAAEWADFQPQDARADLVRAITPRVQTFEAGATVVPGIRALTLAGHTPGHTGYEIGSGADRVLYLGDAMHSSLISVQRPEWVNAWDSDSAAAIATRQGLLEQGVVGSRRIYAPHFPFPGLGRFQRRDDGFVWLPEPAAD